MKKVFLTLLVLGSAYATKAQTIQRDSAMMNANDYKADSVKRGNNIYIDGNHSSKPADRTNKSKSQPTEKAVGTKPNNTTTSGSTE